MAISSTNGASSSSSSSSSSTPPHFKHDVFLSFRGTDTRKNFTGHLLAALKQRGISTFIDDIELKRGEFINFELLKAIEESRIALIVFSKNYATSRWCLDELVKIMECRKTFQQIVLPIFYDVDPSNVRAQKDSLAEAFAKHEEHFKHGSNGSKVEKWREALTEIANLSGWDLNNTTNGHEAKFIEKIVEEIGIEINFTDLNVASHPIGLMSRLKNLNTLVSMDSNDVRIVGIWGIGGIGKTTIAKMLYNLIHHKFEGHSFLANVKESWEQTNGPVLLQNQLFHDIVKNDTHNIRNSDQGIEIIKQRVLCRRVLLVLDDVDNVQQLKALAIDRDFFRPGSRIIITTRNKGCLNFLKVDEIYEPKNLNMEESLQLFSLYAFKEDHPLVGYVWLSNQVVRYAGGLPLALEVLGSYFGEIENDIGIWESAIEKLKKIPHDGIQAKLKISFDSLSNELKDLFLDIACFFSGKSRYFTIKMLKACELYPEIGFNVLLNRCLIKYGPCNELVMHDMLRDMGREIVKKESNDEPGRRSRLWHHEDVLEVLRYNTGTKAVKGLVLNLPQPKVVQVDAKAFEKMNTLWLLHLNFVHLSVGSKHIFRRLLWLSWAGSPLECLPSNFSMEKLVVLDLRYSRLLKQVWKGTKILDKLKFLYLSNCSCLTKTPDFSRVNSLEELLLNECISLVEVDESIGCLNRLLVLNMANCEKLGQLPLSILMLKSLEYLNLSGCSKLRNFAALPRKNMDSIRTSLQGSSLKTLKMDNCNLSCLPSEIGNLISLVDLDVSYNKLCALPDSICNLTSLQNLNMAYNNVSHLPSKIGGLISLTHLDLGRNNLCSFPESACKLACLQNLYISGCNVPYLPYEFGSLISLIHLDLSGNELCTLPDSICNLACLKELVIKNCKLSELPNEFGRLISLEILDLSGNNFPTLPDSFCNLLHLEELLMENCKLLNLPSKFGRLISLEVLDLGGNNLPTLPDGFCNLHHLMVLSMENCKLLNLPSEFGRLISLQNLNLGGNNLSTLPDSLCNLPHLEELLMENCKLLNLPSEFGRLISLTTLDISGNNFCTLPDGICKLTRLDSLMLENCTRLQSLPELPVSLLDLNASGCVSLENIEFKSIVAAIGGDSGITMLLSGCNKLNENNFANNFVEEIIQRHKDYPAFPGSFYFQPFAQTRLCGGQVPICFEYQSTWQCFSLEKPRSHLQLSIRVPPPPPPLINQKAVGIFLCVVFIVVKIEDIEDEGAFDCLIVTKKGPWEVECPVFHPGSWWITGGDMKWLFVGRTRKFEIGDEIDISLTSPPQMEKSRHIRRGSYVKLEHPFKPPILFKKCAVSFLYEDDENIPETNDEALITLPKPSVIQ